MPNIFYFSVFTPVFYCAASILLSQSKLRVNDPHVAGGGGGGQEL